MGPSDWKEHASGKEGAERFCVRNLPINSYTGVYELGVVSPSWLPVPQSDNHSSGIFQPQDVVAVYVGHADNLRRRLQRYGQAGSHLEGPRSVSTLVVVARFQVSRLRSSAGLKQTLLGVYILLIGYEICN